MHGGGRDNNESVVSLPPSSQILESVTNFKLFGDAKQEDQR